MKTIENYNGFQLHTFPNGDCFETHIRIGEELIGASFSSPLDFFSSVEKCKIKIDSGVYEILDYEERLYAAGEIIKTFMQLSHD